MTETTFYDEKMARKLVKNGKPSLAVIIKSMFLCPPAFLDDGLSSQIGTQLQSPVSPYDSSPLRTARWLVLLVDLCVHRMY